MARASTKTLLPLDRFFAILGVHPLHSNQVYIPTQEVAVCDMPVLQYSWMLADKTGREEVAIAIADAESKILQELGFAVAPTWVAWDEVDYPRPHDPRFIAMTMRDLRGFISSVQANNGYIITGGIEAKTLIEADVAITYSDEDGDGYDETATITAATTVTDVNEIALYYPGKDAEDSAEIRPLRKVTIAAGAVTILCRREQLLLERFMEGFSDEAARTQDGLDDANFLTEIDVYRHWNDPSTQVQLISDVASWCGFCIGNGSCATCNYYIQTGCMVVKDERLGLVAVQPGTWSVDDAAYNYLSLADCRAPDRLKLSYYAGYRDLKLTRPLVNMAPEWERAVTYFATSLLDRPLCGCKSVEAQSQHWREDLAISVSTQPKSTTVQLTDQIRNNPLGTKRGALHAWRLIQRMRLASHA